MNDQDLLASALSPVSPIWPAGEVPHPSPWIETPFGRGVTKFDKLQDHEGADASYGCIPLGVHSRQYPRLNAYGRTPFGSHYRLMRYLSGYIGALISQHKDEVLNCDFTLVQGDESPLAEEILDFTKWALDDYLEDLEAAQRDLLDSGPDGIAILELTFREVKNHPRWSGKWAIPRMQDKDMWHFAFVRESPGAPPIFSVRTADRGTAPAPNVKFLRWSQGGDSPWGRAALDEIYTEFVEATRTRNYRAVDNGKWAQPAGGCGVAFAKSSEPNDEAVKTENETRLKRAKTLARNLHANGTLVWDKDVYDPQFLAVQKPGASSYDAALSSLNRVEALQLRRDVQTSGQRPGAGSRASDEEIVRNVAGIMTRLRANGLRRLLSNTVCKWLAWLNYGPDAPAARYRQRDLTKEERELLMRGMEMNDRFGRRAPVSHLEFVTGVPDPSPGESTLTCNPQQESARP